MKFIEYPELAHLSRTLTYDSAECTVHTRLEAYSCKSIHREKKMFKALEHTYAEENAFHLSVSPPEEAAELLASPFGPLDQSSSRKMFYLLIATLNVAFPDHDFSRVRPDAFRREESPAGVVNALSTTLLSLRPMPGSVVDFVPRSYSSYPPSSDTFSPSISGSSPPLAKKGGGVLFSGTHPTFYRILDNIITLKDCDVYSFTPGEEWDPHAVDSDSDDTSEDMSTSDDDDNGAFEFDMDTSSRPFSPSRPSPRSGQSSMDDGDERMSFPRRRSGGLLWSSNWFFHNKKQKRILFVSVWARKRMRMWMPANDTYVGWTSNVGDGVRPATMRA